MFFAGIFVLTLVVDYVFAIKTETQVIKELEKKERDEAPVNVTVPKVEYKTESLKNPFQGYLKKPEAEAASGKQQEVPPPTLTIQGIIWGGELPQAIIDNKVVKVGDVIQEARIIDINKYGVTISFKGRQYNISSPASANMQTQEQKIEGGENEK
jgi:hypothetical protein